MQRRDPGLDCLWRMRNGSTLASARGGDFKRPDVLLIRPIDGNESNVLRFILGLSRTRVKRHTPTTEDYLRAHTIGELRPMSAPILVVPYDPAWPDRFQHECQKIRTAIGEQALRIEHVGSTSVAGLPAKPIIDILLVVADSANEVKYATALEGAG